jgi:hypothetical protein
MSDASDKQMDALAPKDAASLEQFKIVVGTALRVMVGEFPAKDKLAVHHPPSESKFGPYSVFKTEFGHKGGGDRIPTVGVLPHKTTKTVAIWIHPNGKQCLFDGQQVTPAVQMLLDHGISVVAPDVLYTGEQSGALPTVDKRYAGYTFGYNRPPFAEQVRDIVTTVAFAKHIFGAEKIYLVGWRNMGPAVILASAVCGDAVIRTAADMDQFRFQRIEKTDDPMLLPGAVKYGSMGAFTALCAPHEVYLHNHGGTSSGHLNKAAYQAANATDKLTRINKQATPEAVIEWLLR